MFTEENIIIEELILGKQDTFKELVHYYKDIVYNTSLSFLKNETDAEDITQEVFIEIFNSISKFEERSKLSTWIYRITVSKSLDYLRKKKRKKRLAFFTGLLNNNTDNNFEPVEFVHPGVTLENKELSKILFKAIDKLPEKQKIAFLLNKVEGLSYHEICGIMNTSLSSVESLMHRAKIKLQKLLSDYYNK